MLRRFFDEGLSHNSYLLACERTRTAAVIDPRRDVDVYVDAARAQGLTITHAIETHIHADFVSGARELAAVGAVVFAGPGAQLGYPHREAHDGATLRLGDVEITFLQTPGHTPEHISALVVAPGEPARLFTGDTLFVGAVGRPDLVGTAETRNLAGELHHSLFSTLLGLPDDVQVHPGHGAGSLCGAGIGKEPSTTIGREREANPLLQHPSRESFVSAVLADLPETPPYFARMKRINREGPVVLGLADGVAPPAAVTPADAAAGVSRGAIIVDARTADAFGAGHPAGALNLAAGPKLGFWAGWVIPADAPVIALLDAGERDATEIRRQLLRVGLECEGYIGSGFEGWRTAGLPSRQTPQLSAAELRGDGSIRSAMTVVDVRSHREWQQGHLLRALHIPLTELLDRMQEIPRDGTVATICEGGYRSSLAASLLERAGFRHVVNIAGGMSAWRTLQTAAT